MRISHTDFGGRALAGYSSGCTSLPCTNSDWVYQGVIDDSSSTCNSHGTHCGSTAVGSTYGVAKGATLIAVQVLSCAGSGSAAGV